MARTALRLAFVAAFVALQLLATAAVGVEAAGGGGGCPFRARRRDVPVGFAEEARALLSQTSSVRLGGQVGDAHAAGPPEVYPFTVEQLCADFDFLLKKHPAMGAKLLRFTFHDAGTACHPDHSADEGFAANGSLRLELELEKNHEFKSQFQAILTPFKEKYGEKLSWADLIAVGGKCAVEHAGGPKLDVRLGREDADKPDHDIDKRLPGRDEKFEALRKHFAACNMSVCEQVALTTGAHTIGQHDLLNDDEEPIMTENASGEEVEIVVGFDETPRKFDNIVFTNLLGVDPAEASDMLISDKVLLEDPEAKACVEKFSENEHAFFQHFKASYEKLVEL